MNRLNAVTTRMGPDLRDAIEAMPGLGGLALWVQFVDSDDPEMIAATDGVNVAAGPRYLEYSVNERRFVLLHELLHVALAHPARVKEMQKRCRDFDQCLFNIASDAIVNASLDGVRGIQMPDGSVTLERVLTLIGHWKTGDKIAEAVRRWSSEMLYRAMLSSGKQADLYALDAESGLKSTDIVATSGLPGAGCSQTQESGSTEETIRVWGARLAVARGSLAGVLNRLALELPRVKTPWERILRDMLFRHAQRKRRPDPSHPSRRWLALESHFKHHEGIDLPYERATKASRTGRIALAVDTSGSINDGILSRFAAEIAAVLKQTEPQLRLIVCDAGVHQICDFAGIEGAKLLRGFKFKGGGGTDFRPAIAEASKWKPDLLIYLTDLEGEAGDEPGFPVLWAVAEGRATAPWGRVIELV
jgi:Putative metallopeptidase domain/VWA-like domain (DUF2201)